METKVLDKFNKEAVNCVKNGGIAAFPTETVYGMGVISSSLEAYGKLVKVKGRPSNKPFTLMCSNYSQIVKYAYVNNFILKAMKLLMPGEVTFLLRARKGIPSYIDNGTGIIGVRIPDTIELLSFIEEVGQPLLVPSANKSGEPTSTTFEEVYNVFNNEIEIIVKGRCNSNVPSTIFDLTNDDVKVIRQGKIRLEELLMAEKENPIVVSLASDHGGFEYKEAIKKHLIDMNIEAIDCGCFDLESCDYPDFAVLAASKVATKEADFGILVCTSGEGVCIVANKVKGVRCGIGYNDEVTAKLREHNDANMIAFGQKYMDLEDVLRRVDIFLATDFSPLTKHRRRVKKITDIE